MNHCIRLLSITFLVLIMLFIKPCNILVIAKTGGEIHMQLKSNAFSDNEMIPARYTCDGENASPELIIIDVPESAKSLALIVDDPDAPFGTFTHWVMYNIPVDIHSINSNVKHAEQLSDGRIQGINDFGKIGYGGPCPPTGTHRYFFKIYALDKNLSFTPSKSKQDLEKEMAKHIIEKAELIGNYKRK